MGSGLFINSTDGGKTINYAANLKAASYIDFYNPQLDMNGESRTTSSISDGAKLFVTPRKTALIYQASNSLVTTVKYCNRVSIDGGTVTAYYSGFNRFTDRGLRIMEYDVFQIIGSQQQGFGLFLKDSTNFSSITDSLTVGQCVYRTAVNIKGTFQIPKDIPNFDKSIVFASWNSSDRALYLDRASMQVRVYTDSVGGLAQWRGDCFAEIVVISNVPYEAHNGGLTLFNHENGKVVFSSRLPPFIYRGIGITLSNTPGSYSYPNGDVSRAMVPLCTLGAQRADTQSGGGWWNIYHCGLRMLNNSVTSWRTTQASVHNDRGGPFYNYTTPITLPVIDAADYF